VDQISDFLSDLPIGFIIFAIAMLFGLFGRDDKKQEQQAPAQRRTQSPAAPSAPSTFASDDRRKREEATARREREQQEVIVFGGLDFGSRGSMFAGDGNDRDSQWGKTKYGFDESEWGSANQWGGSFGEKKDSEPVIR
jgi:hypothetical protein